MKKSTETKETISTILNAFLPYLNERQKRLFVGITANALGYGGLKFVHESTGIAETTIISGQKEFASDFMEDCKCSDTVETDRKKENSNKASIDSADDTDKYDSGRSRKPGGGRKTAFEKNPELLKIIENIISEETYGNPENPLKWTTASLRKIAEAVCGMGIKISQNIVSKALDILGYSKQKNQKMCQLGDQHPDRNAQFEYINDTAKSFLDTGLPVISIDTKKKENLGNFKNEGKEYRKEKNPRKVLDHDFPLPELGKVCPYGVYVLNNNTGFVNLGMSHDTAEFASASVFRWWECIGKNTFPNADKIYITCDGGGSNGSRIWMWKYYLQELSDKTNLEIHVSHFPPGTSKWNKIEHRLFCYISKNWEGKPLVDIETVVNLIGSTTTKEGLKVVCEVDENTYLTGIKISEEQKESVNIEFLGPNEKWNYIIRPREK